MLDEKKREAIIKILDEEECWVHVAYHYLKSIRGSVFVGFKGDGTPDLRTNAGRIMKKLADAIGYTVTKDGMKIKR